MDTQDNLAFSLARALASANRRAAEAGVDTQHSRITVKQQESEQGPVWRVFYGSLNPVGHRGGGLLVDVHVEDASITRVVRGQ